MKVILIETLQKLLPGPVGPPYSDASSIDAPVLTLMQGGIKPRPDSLIVRKYLCAESRVQALAQGQFVMTFMLVRAAFADPAPHDW